MIVAIQQPEHLPWLGFFDKMSRCDHFVLLDNVQYKKRYFENRNRIRTPEGSAWITANVKTRGRYRQQIREVELDDESRWRRKYWLAVTHAYTRAPYFADHAAGFEQMLSQDHSRLVDLNLAFIRQVRQILGIRTPMSLASERTDDGRSGGELILSICREFGAERYLSGPDGATYLELPRFEEQGIEVIYHQYPHPTYRQLHEPFVSHMSVIDLIFNHGPDSFEILRG